jgi:hypothetical protein
MQQTDESSWRKEAIAFSRYIVGEEPDEQSIALYIAAQQKLNIPISPKESNKIRFIVRFPGTMGMIDGALALLNPEHPVRKKLYTMFSILESSPKYHKYFLPQERADSYKFYILLVGLRAIFNTISGLFLLPWI